MSKKFTPAASTRTSTCPAPAETCTSSSCITSGPPVWWARMARAIAPPQRPTGARCAFRHMRLCIALDGIALTPRRRLLLLVSQQLQLVPRRERLLPHRLRLAGSIVEPVALGVAQQLLRRLRHLVQALFRLLHPATLLEHRVDAGRVLAQLREAREQRLQLLAPIADLLGP